MDRVAKVLERYELKKSMAGIVLAQLILVLIFFAMTIYNLSVQEKTGNFYLTFIFCGQSVVSVTILYFGFISIKKKEDVHFKAVVYAYAIYSAIRAATFEADFANIFVEMFVRFALVVLTCHLIALSQNLRRAKLSSLYTYAILAMEVVVHIINSILFFDTGMTLVQKMSTVTSIFFATSLIIFNKARIEQMNFK
ncbi:MAG: hypothetical protein K5773_07025 [Pseudobutyrivibrio sp.]|nr:hypothetical protein [Pseudobutyrivibrio sp.]